MTARGLRRWATHAFAAFGVVALLLQSYQALWNRPLPPGYAEAVALVTAAASAVYGLLRIIPARMVVRDLDRPRCRIEVVSGNLFDQEDGHLVVGFSDVFDTDSSEDRVVRQGSVQGQFLHRVYGGDGTRLDAELDAALFEAPVALARPGQEKRLGKSVRYPIGTVAVLGEPQRRYFCVAYSRMGANLVAQSSADALWHSLSRLWTAVHEHGQRRPLAMPVVGSALARIDALDREALLRLILLSFVAASRSRLLTTRLRIVVPPAEFAQLNRAELQAFLYSL